MISSEVVTRFLSEGDLPDDGEYVLGRVLNKPWRDADDLSGSRFFVVVKFVRGISEAERDTLPDSDPRKRIFMFGDEFGNNEKGYEWSSFGTSRFFGQEIDAWVSLDDIQYQKE